MRIPRIILADDHSMFRAGLRTLIEKTGRFEVVGEASDGEELLTRLKGGRCSLVVMDVSMPRMDGTAALEIMARRYPRLRTLVLTMHKDVQYFREAMAAGAGGYLLKDDAFEQLVKAMDIVLSGGRFVSPGILPLMEEKDLARGALPVRQKKTAAGEDRLTRREQQILRLVAAGLANKNIAVKLKISVRTVEAHRLNFMKKLGVRTTAGLVRYAMEAFPSGE